MRMRSNQSIDSVTSKEELTLYFPDIFDKEEERARRSYHSYDMNHEIQLDDYKIYKQIGENYCNPGLIKELGKAGKELPWIEELSDVPWVNNLIDKATAIKETMDDYDS